MKKACAPGGTQAFAGSYLLRFGSADGTYARAGTALDALRSIDLIFAVASRNAGNGALCFASAAADALFADNICHGDTPPYEFFPLL